MFRYLWDKLNECLSGISTLMVAISLVPIIFLGYGIQEGNWLQVNISSWILATMWFPCALAAYGKFMDAVERFHRRYNDNIN